MTAPKPKSPPDDKPRFVVVVAVVLICSGAIVFFLMDRLRPAKRQSAPGPTSGAVEVTEETESDAANNVPIPARRRSFSRPATRSAFRPTINPPTGTDEANEPASSSFNPTEPAESETLLASTAVVGVPVDFGIEITGKVVLDGEPPPEVRIDMSSDPHCGTLQHSPVKTRHYLVDRHRGLADVFVHIKSGLAQTNFPAPASEPLLDQTGCLYQPYVLGVMVNQKFKIRNSDPTLHNVHAQPRKGDNEEFNFAQPSKGQVNEKSFPSPEIFVRFKCDVHPWMFAFVGVVDNPFFAVTGADGTFQLPPGLPPGGYVVEAIHPKAGAVTQEITVRAGEKKKLSFTLRVPRSSGR